MKKKERQRAKKANKLLVSALIMGVLSSPAFAEDVNTWSGLKGAVEGSTEQINVTGNITRGASDEDITISRTLSIVGTETSRYLSGNGAYAGLAIVAGGNLTLTDINMQNFKIEGSNESGGAIYNYAASGNSSVESITGNFTSNSISGYAGTGGAIYNYAESNDIGSHIGSIGNITGDFTSNSASLNHNSGAGGAIYNYAYDNNARANIGNIIGNFTSNSVGSDGSGGAIYNFATLSAIGSIGNITGDFTSNSAGHTGGAICNYARGGGQATLSILATNNKDVTFNGNYMTSASGKGGAIYNHSEDATAIIGLYADTNRTITFVGGADATGKYDIDGIYNDSTLNINGNGTDTYTGTVNLYKVSDAHPTDPTQFKGTTNIYDGTVNVKDTFTQNTLNVKSGTFNLEKNANISYSYLYGGNVNAKAGFTGTTAQLEGGTLNLGKGGAVTNLAIASGALSMSIADATYTNTIDTLNVNNYEGQLTNFTVDYDADAVAGSNMDKITINTGAETGSSITLTGVNVIKDGTTMAEGTFIDGVLNNITDNTDSVTSTTTSGGWKYTFTPSSKGVVTVTRTAVEETLAQVIQNATGSSSFSINTNPYTTNENLGSLAGDGRNFTINGNGNAIDGNEYEGITINEGQTFALNNADMKNFKKETGTKNGGAIENKGTITNITGNFSNNEATTNGGAIWNNGTIGNADGTGGITGNFNDNTAKSGAAIWNESGTITNINGNFTSNTSTNGYGAIYNKLGAIIGNADGTGGIEGNFSENAATNGGAITNAGTITNIKGNFTNNSATQNGGAILNSKTINKITGNFTNNSATQNGGAVYNAKTINFVAENGKNITFNGNYVTDENRKGGAVFNATTGTVGLYASADHSITFTGDTTGLPSTAKNVDSIHNIGILNINGDGTITPYKGTVNLYNVSDAAAARGTTNIYGGIVNANGDFTQKELNIDNAKFSANKDLNISDKISLTNSAELSLGQIAVDSSLTRPINLSMTNSTLNLQNNSTGILNIGTLGLAGNNDLMLDADLANCSMDMLQVASLDSTLNTGTIRISDIKLMSDAIADYVEMPLFIDDTTRGLLANKVTGNLNGLKYSPIYKYDALYNPETGMVGFTRYNTGGYDDLNPSIMAGEVAAQMGGYLNLIQTYENSFEHMDAYMLMTSRERLAMKMRNRYAAADGNSNLMTYSPNQTPESQRGMWVKPFASFEKVNLNNGPRVENNTYGTFLGGDSDLIELKHGWDAVFSGHVSYNGSHQNYDGVSVYQNGGTLGGTATWYKGNFFTGLTANVGASVAEASTMYGQDNMTMLLAGIANKTGYNWELFKGKFILQPSMLISYSFVNTFDFKNAAGVNVHSNPLNAIQVAPGLKFIGNLPNGWQPYIGLQMVWNIMDDSKVKANDVWLPETSVDPYFQYGVGVQKRWGERFNGFFQTMIRNGGRTGIAFSAGFRWAIGKGAKNSDSIKTSNSIPELSKTKIILSSASK